MLSWKQIVQEFIIKHSDRIKRATRPIHEHFGVGYFTYHRIDRAGNYTVLVDRPDWAEHYVSEKLYLQDPYLRQMDVYQSGFCLIESHGCEEYKKKIIHDGKEIFNLDLGVILIEKTPEYVEFSGFAANRGSSDLEKIYLNHPHLLKAFHNHFKQELGPFLREMEPSPLTELKGKDFFTQDPIHPNVLLSNHLDYLEAVGFKALTRKARLLSKRERDCLKLLLEGKSAKETGVALRISSRTVESYFENIKTKLGCWSKQEVFSLAQQFAKLGLLP